MATNLTIIEGLNRPVYCMSDEMHAAFVDGGFAYPVKRSESKAPRRSPYLHGDTREGFAVETTVQNKTLKPSQFGTLINTQRYVILIRIIYTGHNMPDIVFLMSPNLKLLGGCFHSYFWQAICINCKAARL